MSHLVVDFGAVVDYLVSWFTAIRLTFDLLICPFASLPQGIAKWFVDISQYIDMPWLNNDVIHTIVDFVNNVLDKIVDAINLVSPPLIVFVNNLNTITFLCYFSVPFIIGVWAFKFIWSHIVG